MPCVHKKLYKIIERHVIFRKGLRFKKGKYLVTPSGPPYCFETMAKTKGPVGLSNGDLDNFGENL